jgi:precorrin-6B methylase 2
MTKRAFLIGRTQSVIDDVVEQLGTPEMQLAGGTRITDLQSAFDHAQIDHVFIGGGLDVDTCLEIVREIFQHSNATFVHMNSPSGPRSFLPFVRSVLSGFSQ